ncbi:MAG: histidine--tRNA ligase [Gammaproteobacteria bacterium]|nr:MAG: histidine--tRNA ligase [Gammaproteobacteria bacterium]
MNISSIRGMHPQGPDRTGLWQEVERILVHIAKSYGYKEIRFPVLEKTELFCRAVGQATDIVEKEMYTFIDRNGDQLTLRPEGTASCVKAAHECALLNGQTQKLWYMGPMFRHERPQKGRYRQFHQFGVEVFGEPGAGVLLELILIIERIWKKLGIASQISLQLNSLGSTECRASYRELLVDFFSAHKDDLDEDSQRRLQTNPLRILDSKNPQMQSLIAMAPKLLDHLDEASRAELDSVRTVLDTSGIRYEINPHLVRGLDYYNGLVFEWVTDRLGAQGTVCAGGRYDGLVKQLGGRDMPAAGLAMGLERVLCLCEELETLQPNECADAYFVAFGSDAFAKMLNLKEDLHDRMEEYILQINTAGGSFKSQMKKADRSGAKLAIIMGDDELSEGCVGVKFLREDRPQEKVALTELENYLKSHLDKRKHHGINA